MNKGWQLSLLAGSIFVGIAFPALAAFIRPVLMPVIFLLYLCMALQVRFADVAHAAVKEKAAWVILLWQLLVLPLLIYLCLRSVLSPQLYMFAVISMCAGAITGTTALSSLFNLNSALSLLVCVAGALLMPVPLYFFPNVLLDSDLNLDLTMYAVRILVFIALPFSIAFVVRRVVSENTDTLLRRHMPSVALLLLALFGLAVMDGVSEMMFTNPRKLLSYIGLAFSISLGVQLVSFLALRFLGRRDATSAAMLCSYRNLGVAAALVGPSLDNDFFIFLGVWQLPMYILPLVLRRLYEMPKTG